jgi:hypothetical protein
MTPFISMKPNASTLSRLGTANPNAPIRAADRAREALLHG